MMLMSAELHDASTWEWWHFAGFALVIYLGLELLNVLVINAFSSANQIPIRGKHLDEFEFIDNAFIQFNKLAIIVFTYHMIRFTFTAKNICWDIRDLGILNGPSSLVAMHIVYDFFYTLFHRFLHNRIVYRFVHKHHHRQRAPTRGNLDAINVHPFEFVVGEYIHLVAAFLVSRVMTIHVGAIAWFVAVGGLLASLNHTRYDLSFLGVYSVKVHDVHHRLPESNYGQYIMLWDKLMGSYKPYTTEKSVSAKAQ
eukprot:CAMPEP_0170178396 /NCGR_PEP_ID=MMETSP0040_2-20121228/11856_1 /TAXON_ID=641309 /ORGANISM="Lotharella oceanica, Strain CCMP622" /LENGTH=252 /DNA_ID=CAMNT_0010421443 /DNA_START=49 /DNA_END=807 /DNA_ORIENTATION=-